MAVDHLAIRLDIPVETLDTPPVPVASMTDAFKTLQGQAVWATHGDWITRENPTLAPDIAARFQTAAAVTDAQAADAQQVRQAVIEAVDQVLADGVLFLLPSAHAPAPKRGLPEAQRDAYRQSLLPLTCLAGLAGLPQISLPLAQVDGLPIGLSAIAARHQDETLLSLL